MSGAMGNCKFCNVAIKAQTYEDGDACNRCWDVSRRLNDMSSFTLTKICEHHGYTLLDNGHMRSIADHIKRYGKRNIPE